MKLTKRSLPSLLVIVSFLLWTYPAQAQKSAVLNQTSSFQGLEVAPGWVEGDDVYGWVCYGKLTGSVNGNLTLMMDYGGMPMLGGTSLIERGTWTLPVYTKTIRGETYMGVMYGNVSYGEVSWDKYGNATMTLNLNITGGTQTLEGISGSGQFIASTYYDGTSTRMKGDIYFF